MNFEVEAVQNFGSKLALAITVAQIRCADHR
jgi:hypothetical protein